MRKIKGLDGFRAVGMLIVFFQHKITPSLEIGTVALYIFFMMSGYLITSGLRYQRARIESGQSGVLRELKNFHVKRVLRIFPLYYLILTICLVTLGLWLKKFPLSSFPWYFGYMSNIYIGFVTERWPSVFSHLWSLAAEEQFYTMIAPIMLMVASRYHSRVLSGLLAISVIITTWFWCAGAPQVALYNIPTLSFVPMIMGALFVVYEKQWTAVGDKTIATSFGLMVGYWLWHFTLGPGWVLTEADQFLIKAIVEIQFSCIFIMYVINCQASTLVRCLEWGWLPRFGAISYGFYLIHNFMPMYMVHHDKIDRILPGFLPQPVREYGFGFMIFLATWALAELSARYFEKPIMTLKDRLIG